MKHYTKQNLSDPRGPVTVVAGKKRRLTLVECPPDLPGRDEGERGGKGKGEGKGQGKGKGEAEGKGKGEGEGEGEGKVEGRRRGWGLQEGSML